MKKKIALIMTLTLLFSSVSPMTAISAENGEPADEEIMSALEAANEPEFEIGEDVEEVSGSEIVEADGIAEDEVIPDNADVSVEELSGLIEDEELLAAASEEGAEILLPGTEEHVVLSALPDTEDLFATYVEREFRNGGESSLEAASDKTYGLEGSELIIYQEMKRAIEEIAAGARTSTEIGITLESLGYPAGKTFSAAELGVDALVVNEAITAEAKAAMYAKIAYSQNMWDALLADCPYDLYWYEKTVGTKISIAGLSGNSRALRFSSDPVLTFKMSVSQDFAGTTTYTTDSTKTGAAKTAAQNAKEVVSANTSLNDTKKLQAYKNFITENVSYNTTAASNNATPYGNPWQLIWVFDEDDSTGVVCEGYSKAFKYLCDCSQFSNPTLECLLVSGTMSGGTGAGRHMWNLVVTGRRSYLADITNSDTGTIGSDGRLFMAGSGSATGSGYTVGGVTFTYDDDMDILYDENVRKIYSKNYFEDVDSATGQEINGHSYGEWETIKEPTCSEDGQETATCDLCGVRQTKTISKLEHDWGEGVVTTEPTCTTAGVRTYTCSRDGETRTEEIAAFGHKWKEPTYVWTEDNRSVTATRICENDGTHTETETVSTTVEKTTPATCEKTGKAVYTAEFTNVAFETQTREVVITALGHKWNDGEVTAEPTCTENGEKKYTCQNDPSHTKTEAITALGHKWDSGTVTTKPTCTAKGVKTYTCQNDSRHTKTEAIAALGHKWDAGAVTKKATTAAAGVRTYTCRNCNGKRTESIPKIKEKITITQKPSIKNPKATAKDKVTVTWKNFKQTKKTKPIWKNVRKVEIQYCTSKSFVTGVKSTSVSRSKTKATLKKLSKNTTYYVRIRYVDGKGGYSAWSAVKTVKTKKK